MGLALNIAANAAIAFILPVQAWVMAGTGVIYAVKINKRERL